jgi:hypothetical protein
VTISERIAAARREGRVLARVSRAAWRLDQAERERTWALVSARAEGKSIRILATAIGLSPSQVHQIVRRPGTRGRPSDTSAARPASGRATPTIRAGHADHPPSLPAAFRKLDAVTVLTARLLPAPLLLKEAYDAVRAL